MSKNKDYKEILKLIKILEDTAKSRFFDEKFFEKYMTKEEQKQYKNLFTSLKHLVKGE